MKKFLFTDFLSVFDLICIYGISYLSTHNLWYLLLVIPAIMISRAERRITRIIEIHISSAGGSGGKQSKVPVIVPKRFRNEVAWNHTMSASDHRALLNIMGYVQHRLINHKECGIRGVVALERVQKFIKELS